VSRARRLAVAILGTVIGSAAGVPAEAAVEISAEPPLRPGFERGTTDYVSRCDPGKPVRLSVRASGSDRV
jgi:hypothetical protein